MWSSPPPTTRWPPRAAVGLAALAGETFLLREAGSGTRELLRSLLAAAGLDPGLGMEMGSNETIKQAVMAGMGIALLSAHTVAAELADGRLVALDVAGLPVVRQWFVVRSRDKRLLPAGAGAVGPPGGARGRLPARGAAVGRRAV